MVKAKVVKEKPKLKNREEADQAGMQLLSIEQEIAEVNNHLDKDRLPHQEKIAALEKQAAETLAPLSAGKALIEEALSDWYKATPERDVGTKGQITLTHVRLKGKELINWSWPEGAALAQAVKTAVKKGWEKFIKQPKPADPALDKAKIKAEAGDKELEALGVTKSTETTVTIETL